MLTLTVPSSIQKIARDALTLHRDPARALEDVHGLAVAEALSSGSITVDVVSKANSFFTVNRLRYCAECDALRTEVDGPATRSWLLHGGEAGERWFAKMFHEYSSKGLLAEDPVLELFSMEPDRVYAAFQAGAWRYVYDLDPRKAAKFVDEYVRATGKLFEINRAFGDSAPAVGNALYRRFHAPDPMRQKMRELFSLFESGEDYDLETALIDEALKLNTWSSLASKSAAKLAWPTLVAYLAMADVDAKLLLPLNVSPYKRIGPLHQPILSPLKYNDAVNTFNTYFNIHGGRYDDDNDPEDHGFPDLEFDLHDLMNDVGRGYQKTKAVILPLLKDALKWAETTDNSHPVFKAAVLAYSAGNYDKLLILVSPESDVYPALLAYADEKSGAGGADAIEPEDVVTVDSKSVKTGAGATTGTKNPEKQTDIKGAEQPALVKDTGESDVPGEYTIQQFIKDTFGDELGEFKYKPMSATAAHQAIEMQYENYHLEEGTLVEHVKSGTYFEIVKAFLVKSLVTDTTTGEKYDGGDIVIFTKDDEGLFNHTSDAKLTALIEAEKVVPVDVAALEEVSSLIDQPLPEKVFTLLKQEHGALMDGAKQINIVDTNEFYAEAIKAGADGKQFEHWAVVEEDFDPQEVIVHGVVRLANSMEVLVLAPPANLDGLNEWSVVQSLAAHNVKTEKMIPWSKWEAKKSELAKKVEQKFPTGSLIEVDGTPMYVAGLATEVYDQPYYVAAELPLDFGHSGKAGTYDVGVFHTQGKLIDAKPSLEVLVKHVLILSPHKYIATTKLPDGVSIGIGSSIQLPGGELGTVAQFVTENAATPADQIIAVYSEVQATSKFAYVRFAVISIDPYISPATSSYAPGEKPEPGSEDSIADGKPPLEYLFGTPGALKWLQDEPASGKGTTDLMFPEAPASAPMGTFLFALGEKRQFKSSSYVATVVGFVRLQGKYNTTYGYLLLTPSDGYNWKSVSKAHADYVTLVETEQSVLNEAIPLPDWTPEPFPKVNYALGKVAKDIATKHSVIYQKSEKDAPFKVGTYLVGAGQDGVWRVVGWMKEVPSDALDAPKAAVLASVDYSKDSKWKKVNAVSLSSWSLKLQTETEANEKTGDLAFSKMTNQPVSIWLSLPGGAKIPSFPPAGWDKTEPVVQPVFEKVLPGKHASAGIIAFVENYAYSVAKLSGGKMSSQPGIGVVLVRPFNDFAGYTLSFPKGTVDPGEGVQAAAVREFWEESGMTATPLKYLGDYVGGSSVTRYFAGRLTGGDPSKAGSETDGVFIKALSHDWKEVITQPWYAELHERDKKALKDAHAWNIALLSGVYSVNPETAATDVQVTLPQDTGSKGPQTVKPGKGDVAVLLGYQFGNVTKNVTQVGYVVSAEAVVTAVKGYSEITKPKYWGWLDQSVVVGQHGYPNVGTQVQTSGQAYLPDGLYTVVGYVLFSEDLSKAAGVHLWLKSEKTGLYKALLIGVVSAKPDAGVYAKYIGPQMFPLPVTVDTQSTAAPKPVPASANTEAWNKLAAQALVPLDYWMLNALKQDWKKQTGSMNLDSYSVSKTVKGSSVGYYEAFKVAGTTDIGIAVGSVYLRKPGWTPGDSSGEIFYVLGLFSAGSQKRALAVNPASIISAEADVDKSGWKASYTFADQWKQDWVEKFAKIKTNSWQGVGQFKQWCKAAGVKGHSKITKNNARAYAALFLPLPWPANSHAQAALDEQQKQEAHEKKVAKHYAPSAVSPMYSSPSADVSTTPTPKVIIPTAKPGLFSAEHTKFIENIDASLLKKTGKSVAGGSKPNMLLDGPNGTQWFYKTVTGTDTFRAQIDEAAYKMALAVGRKMLPTGVVEIDGKPGSLQPFLSDAKSVSHDAADLDASQMADVLGQHVLDMFVGDHDGHSGNWLKVGDKMVPIDRGQSFKFLFEKVPESLDPHWHAPGNVGSNYAKGLLIKWESDKATIPDIAFVSMRTTITGIQSMTDAQVAMILEPVFVARSSSAAERKHVLTGLKKRRDALLDDWTEVLTKLKSSFKWPGIGGAGSVFVSEPSDMAFTTKESTVIQEAIDAKWQGKCVQIDRDAIENHQVMVRGVRLPDGTLGTLVHFRVSPKWGVDIVSSLFKRAGLDKNKLLTTVQQSQSTAAMQAATKEKQGYATSDQILQLDEINKYFEIIRTAIGHLNYHLADQGDLSLKSEKVQPAIGKKADLVALLAEADANPKARHPLSNDKYSDLAKMAQQYMGYIDTIADIYAHPSDNLGKASVTMKQYAVVKESVKKEAPPEKKAEEIEDGLKVTFKTGGAEYPRLEPGVNGDYPKLLTGNKPIDNSAAQSQFIIRDPGTEAVIYMAAPTGGIDASKSYGESATAEGLRGFHGVTWGLIQLPPNAMSVAHLMKMFERATTAKMRPAMKIDREFAYWMNQAALLQGKGTVTPHSTYHTAVTDPILVVAETAYKAGNDEDALSSVKAFVAQNLKVKVGDLEKLENYTLEPHYTRGAGFNRTLRVDITSKDLDEKLPKNVYPAHRLLSYSAILPGLKDMSKNGALMSNNVKPFYGVPFGKSGASAPADLSYGGSQGLFGVLSPLKKGGHGTLYFDRTILLRTDVYFVGTGDTFGRDGVERIFSLDRWANLVFSGSISSGSHPQLNYRHDIDLREYLYLAYCTTSELAEVKAFCKALGWTSFAQGRTIDQVFVS
jgi:8-oxo-dGTP pyrophosphatase MutT (NUDIX family)